MSYLDIHDSKLVHYCGSMSHDGNPFNVTGFVFAEVLTNYFYSPTYNSLPYLRR